MKTKNPEYWVQYFYTTREGIDSKGWYVAHKAPVSPRAVQMSIKRLHGILGPVSGYSYYRNGAIIWQVTLENGVWVYSRNIF